MKMHQNHRLFSVLLGSFLLLLLAACGSTPTSSTNPSPTPTATPTVTASATPTQAPKLTVTFGCNGSKEGFFADNSRGKACVRTLPGASLSIAVSYCNGVPDTSNALKGNFMADNTGYYEWNWIPQATCQNGPAYWSGKATVTARLYGQTASSESDFQAG